MPPLTKVSVIDVEELYLVRKHEQLHQAGVNVYVNCKLG